MLNVLLSAYACFPSAGSEPYVGWQWALQAAREHNVWVLTEPLGRPKIEEELAARPRPRLHIVYHDVPGWLRSLLHLRGGTRLHYALWQLTAPLTAYRQHRQTGFDVVHHVTYNTIDTPGFLPLLKIPFVWGPVGGAQLSPHELRSYFGSGWRRERLRNLQKRWARWNPWNRYVARHAAAVLTANQETADALRSMGAINLIAEMNPGVDVPAACPKPHSRTHGALTITWAGLLIPRKAPELALDVLAALRSRGVDAHLRIAGEGELRNDLEARSRELGIAESVEFLGRIDHDDMSEFYEQSDVFLFTSLQDTWGYVVVEAMARGLPVVTLNHQGVAGMMTNETGTLVPLGSPQQVVERLTDALQRLADDPALQVRQGYAAWAFIVAHNHWDLKANLLNELYSRIAGNGRVPSGS